MNDYRYVVSGSPYYKEHHNAPPEPVGSNILQNKAIAIHPHADPRNHWTRLFLCFRCNFVWQWKLRCMLMGVLFLVCAFGAGSLCAARIGELVLSYRGSSGHLG
eukprot:scaffold224205_cov40-Attheya_sp.AAC.1